MGKSHLYRIIVLGLFVSSTSCTSPYDRALVRDREAALFGPRSRASSHVTSGAPSRASDVTQDSEPTFEPGESADLDAYVLYGLRNNGALRSAFEDWQAALQRIEQAGTLPDPRLTYGEFVEEVQTRTGPQERRIGLAQAFPWIGELDAKSTVAELRAEAFWYRAEAERLAVAEAIEVAYHEYAFLGTNIRITREVLLLLQRLEPIVQRRIQSGGKQEDLLRLQVEIGKLENDLAGLEKRRPSLSARLAAGMNHPGRTLLPQPQLLEPNLDATAADDLVDLALERNPVLRALHEELRRSQEAIELAKFESTPSFSLGVDYIQTGSAIAPGTAGSGDDPVALTLGLSLPVWTKSYAAAEREAKHMARAVRMRIADHEFRLRADVEAESYRLDDAARQVALYRDSLIPRARETLELTLASYRSGKASVLDLIDSERSLLDFQLTFWRACRDHEQSAARLESLIGEEPR